MLQAANASAIRNKPYQPGSHRANAGDTRGGTRAPTAPSQRRHQVQPPLPARRRRQRQRAAPGIRVRCGGAALWRQQRACWRVGSGARRWHNCLRQHRPLWIAHGTAPRARDNAADRAPAATAWPRGAVPAAQRRLRQRAASVQVRTLRDSLGTHARLPTHRAARQLRQHESCRDAVQHAQPTARKCVRDACVSWRRGRANATPVRLAPEGLGPHRRRACVTPVALRQLMRGAAHRWAVQAPRRRAGGARRRGAARGVATGCAVCAALASSPAQPRPASSERSVERGSAAEARKNTHLSSLAAGPCFRRRNHA